MKANRPNRLTLRVLTTLILTSIVLGNAQAALASTKVPAAEAELVASQKAALARNYHWTAAGNWNSTELAVLLKAGEELQQYIETVANADGQVWIRKHIGPVTFHKQSLINLLFKIHITLPTRDIYLLNQDIPTYLGPRFILHELAHLLDNNLGGKLPASLFGRGPSEEMVAEVGGHPERCPIKFYCPWDYSKNIAGPETWGNSAYGNHSVADDFADTFTFAIRDRFHTPEQRLAWMDAFVRNLK